MAQEETLNDITRTVLDKFGKDIITELVKELAKRNKNASGNLSKSFNYQLSDFINSIQLNFSALDYEKFIESGRKPGTYPPVKNIQQWCSYRGIDPKAAYAISNKIYALGIKPTPYVDELLKSSDGISKLIPVIEDNYKKEIEITIDKLIQPK